MEANVGLGRKLVSTEKKSLECGHVSKGLKLEFLTEEKSFLETRFGCFEEGKKRGRCIKLQQ